MSSEHDTTALNGALARARTNSAVLVDMLRDRGTLVVLVATMLACFAAAHAGALLRLQPNSLAPISPSSAVAVGIVLSVVGNQRTAAVVGALVALSASNLLMGRSLGATATLLVGHALEFVSILAIMQRVSTLPFAAPRFRDLVALFGAAIGGATLSGIVVAVGLTASSFSSASFVQSWWAWGAAHVVSISAMSPAIAMLGALAQQRRPMGRADTEGLAGLLILSVLAILLYGGWGEFASPLAIANLAILLPVLLWLAMRCPPIYSAVSVLILAAAVSYDMAMGTLAGSSLLVPPGDRATAAQELILFSSFSLMALSLVSEEQREIAARLDLNEHKYHSIYDRTHAFMGLLDRDGRVLDVNQRALDFVQLPLAAVAGRPFWETPWWEHCQASREKLKVAIEKAR